MLVPLLQLEKEKSPKGKYICSNQEKKKKSEIGAVQRSTKSAEVNQNVVKYG